MLKYLDKAAFLVTIGLLAWFVYSDIRDVRGLNQSRENLIGAVERTKSFIESNKDGFQTPPMESSKVSDRVLSPWRDAPSAGNFNRLDFYDR